MGEDSGVASFVLQEICDDNKSLRDKGLPTLLRRTKPVQRLQVSVWHLTDGHISDAVVRPAEQVHAAQGLQRLCLRFLISRKVLSLMKSSDRRSKC